MASEIAMYSPKISRWAAANVTACAVQAAMPKEAHAATALATTETNRFLHVRLVASAKPQPTLFMTHIELTGINLSFQVRGIVGIPTWDSTA
jgi:hypothetical protein